MSFVPNPLALSIPEQSFEIWLRDSNYLEILDSISSSSNPPQKTPKSAIFSFLRTFISLFTINLFSKLNPEDFSGETPSWTLGFVGNFGSYSWPLGPAQARIRVQENVRRFARNYALLCLIFFACSLYQMPVLLFSLLASLGIWEIMRFCSCKWEMEKNHPVLRRFLLCSGQFAMLVILYSSNIQLALLYTSAVSYAVLLLHASLRKLAPSKHNFRRNQHRRPYQKKLNLPSK